MKALIKLMLSPTVCIACAGCSSVSYRPIPSTASWNNRTTISKVLMSPTCDDGQSGRLSFGFEAQTQYEPTGTMGPPYTIVFEQPNVNLNVLNSADWLMESGAAYVSVADLSPSPSPVATSSWGVKWRIIVTRSYIIGVEGRHAYVSVSKDANGYEHVEILAKGSTQNAVGGVEIWRNGSKNLWLTVKGDQYVELIEGQQSPPTPVAAPTNATFPIVVDRLDRKAACLRLSYPDAIEIERTIPVQSTH